MRIIRSLAVLSGLAFSAVAGAVQWGEDITGPEFPAGLTAGSIYCSTTTCKLSQNDPALSGPIIKMTAYQTPFNTGVQNVNPTEKNTTTSLWLTAQIRTFSIGGHVGIGITGADDTSITTAGAEAMIDNNGVDDILVVDFLSTGWDVNSISIGKTCNAYTGTSNTCPSRDADISAWLTDTLPTAFALNNNNGATALNVASTALTFTGNNGAAGPGQRFVDGTATGRYLILTGNTNSYKDAFTIKGLSATKVGSPVPGQVPLPGSVPLIGLALLALAWVSRSRRLRTIPIRIRRS